MAENNIEISNNGQKQTVARPNKMEEYQVVLPCHVKDFRSFVSGLLGKPQVMNGEVKGVFVAGVQEIENIFYLITQRVNQQNDGSLIHFSICVYYSNGNSVTHNSLEIFHNYNPIDDCHPIGIVLNFTYLVNFPTKNAPEKQTIEVAIATDDIPHESVARRHVGFGLYEYRIEYTDRTWATDISSLLKNHGKTLVDSGDKISNFWHCQKDESFEHAITILLIITVGYWSVHSYSILGKIDIENFNNNVIINLLKYFVGSISIISILGLALFGVKRYFEYNYFRTIESFIVLVEKDKKYMKSQKSKFSKNMLIHMTAWISSIGASLVASYIYSRNFFLF